MIRSLRDRCRALAGRRQPGRAALLHQGGIEGVPGACSMPSWDAATSAGDHRPRLPGQTAAGPEPTAFVPGGGCPTDPVYPSRCSSRTGPDADRRPERQKNRNLNCSALNRNLNCNLLTFFLGLEPIFPRINPDWHLTWLRQCSLSYPVTFLSVGALPDLALEMLDYFCVCALLICYVPTLFFFKEQKNQNCLFFLLLR